MTTRANKTAALRPAAKAAKDGTPSDAEMAQINAYTLREHSPDEVYSRSYYLAHNAIDRDGEVFDEALLQDFARTLPGKGLFVRHPSGWDGDSGPGEGRWYAARVVTMGLEQARAVLREPDLRWPPGAEEAHLLEASAYMVRTAESAALIAKLDAGVAGDVSIGFRFADSQPVDTGADRAVRRLLGPGEAMEGSLVWMGAQPGARAYKGARRRKTDDDGEITVPETIDEKTAQQITARAEQAEARAQELAPKAAYHDALRKALGEDDAGLAERPDKIAALIGEGRAYRKSLVDDILRCKRLLGLVGDTDQAVAAARALYDGAPVAVLEDERKALAAKVPGGKQQIDGADPNAAKDQPAGKGLRDAAVTAKALAPERAA